MAKTQSKAVKIESLLTSALNVSSTGVSKEAQTVSSSVLMAAINYAILKSKSIPTDDLTESFKTNSPSVKKQKTFDTGITIVEDFTIQFCIAR